MKKAKRKPQHRRKGLCFGRKNKEKECTRKIFSQFKKYVISTKTQCLP